MKFICTHLLPTITTLILRKNFLTVNMKAIQLCLTLCNPMDWMPWNFPGQNTGMGSLSLLQGIFPTQRWNPGLLYCRWILYQLSHKRSSRILESVTYPSSSGFSQPRNLTGISCIAGGFFTNWAIREALLFLSPGLQPKYVLLPHLCLHGLGDTDKCNAGWEPIYSTVTQLLYLACLYLSVFVLIRMLPDFKRNIVYKKWRERTFNHWKTQALLFLPKEIWKNTQSIYILDKFIIKMTLNSFAIYISETSCFDVPQNW